MRAETILKDACVPHKIVPVPRRISSDCGACIRFFPEDRDGFENALAEEVEIDTIQPL
jgi:hypothetical protein